MLSASELIDLQRNCLDLYTIFVSYFQCIYLKFYFETDLETDWIQFKLKLTELSDLELQWQSNCFLFALKIFKVRDKVLNFALNLTLKVWLAKWTQNEVKQDDLELRKSKLIEFQSHRFHRFQITWWLVGSLIIEPSSGPPICQRLDIVKMPTNDTADIPTTFAFDESF